jgi:hypothetical protein
MDRTNILRFLFFLHTYIVICVFVALLVTVATLCTISVIGLPITALLVISINTLGEAVCAWNNVQFCILMYPFVCNALSYTDLAALVERFDAEP